MSATTSTQIDVFSDGIIKSVQNGEANPLEVLVMLRALDRASERILKEIKQNFMNEADKYPEKSFEFAGNKIEKSEVGVKYDYSVCGDPVWQHRVNLLTSIQEQVKEREAFLKAIKEPTTIVDESSGEVVTIRPALKTSTDSLKVTIK